MRRSNSFINQLPVVRKVNSPNHRIVIFSTAAERHKHSNDIRDIKLARDKLEDIIL